MSTLVFSSRNLAVDCARVAPGVTETNTPIEAEAALTRLRSFAALPAVALVDSDALVILTGARVALTVQNENGRLFTTRITKGRHAAVEQSPEEIIAFLTAEGAAPNEEADPEARPVRSSQWRKLTRSPWTAGVLSVVALIMAYYTFAPEVPAGVALINDPFRVSGLHQKFNGKYGDSTSAGQTVLLVENGRFVVYTAGPKEGLGEAVMNSSYRYGLRGDEVVLVVANGAVLVPGKDGGLKFNNSVYPRIIAH